VLSATTPRDVVMRKASPSKARAAVAPHTTTMSGASASISAPSHGRQATTSLRVGRS